MNENRKFKILKKIFNKDEFDALEESLIITTDDGYSLFGEYLIKAVGNRFLVSKYNTDLTKYFYKLKNAVVWVCMYKQDKVAHANRVAELDMLLEGANTSIELHESLWDKSNDISAKVVYTNKLQEAKMKRKLIIDELASYVSETNRWQDRRFKEAIK